MSKFHQDSYVSVKTDEELQRSFGAESCCSHAHFTVDGAQLHPSRLVDHRIMVNEQPHSQACHIFLL
jgi:hypothetical protein